MDTSDTAFIWIFLIGVIYVAILYALVRPGSPAAGAVNTVSNALAAVVATATGNTNNTNLTVVQGSQLA